MNLPFEIVASTLISECYTRRNTIFAIFALICLTFLAIGTVWPKKYVAFSIVHVEERNILQSLMQGTAETTQAMDHAANAREIIYGEKIIGKILEHAEWLENGQTEFDIETIKQDIKKKTSIRIVGDNLLRIEYQDSDRMRAYMTANRMAELFISEGASSKSKESKSAFEFIDKQVNEYLIKLTKVEDELRQFHSDNPDARPGQETEVSTRITDLQGRIEQTKLELREAIIRKKSLNNQLSGEAAVTISQSKEGQYRSKINSLQEEMEALRLDYHDTYPDVLRLKHQIDDLKDALKGEIARRKEAISDAQSSGASYVDDAIIFNPVYQQLRTNAANTDTEIATLKTRIYEMEKMLEDEYARARKIFGGEATLAQLTRNYQVNQEIYQDLLRRRENARVSKSLDQDQKGLTLSIQEPAKVPIIPTGLRFIHFMLIGILLGVAIPVGLVYALINFDPRVRFSSAITDQLGVPVIAEISKISSFSDTYNEKINLVKIAFGISLIFLIYGVVGWFKYTGKL